MVSQSLFALRDRQRATLRSCLASDNTTTEWTVLVCDRYSSQIIRTLFPPSAMRRHGVTLNTLIDSPRAAVPNVPALYIIAPTPDNIARLSNDLSTKPLYHRAQVVFTTSITRPLLAALAAQLPIPSPITRVKDAHTGFISLEQNLFTLGMADSYLQSKIIQDDASLNRFIQPIVDGIFSVLLTLGAIPIMRSQRGGPAEAVSKALDQKLRDNLDIFQGSRLASRAFSFRRPLLLMLDRDFDFNAILHHTWTYQPLVHDCLNLSLNKVSLKVREDNNQTPSQKNYTLDPETDSFWRENASSPFPVVAERIEHALNKYRDDVEQINRRAGGDAADLGGDAKQSTRIETANLAAAIATLPELSKRKESIDVHTNIATALLDNINKRSLDAFFEVESQFMTEESRPVMSMSAEEYKVALLELLKGRSNTDTNEKQGEGTAADRLRLFLVYYSVFGRQLSEKDMAEFRGILNAAGADSSIVDLLTKLKGFRHDLVQPKPSALQGSTKAAKLKGLMTSMVNRGYRSVANVAQNAKNIITDQKLSVKVARVLELFMSEQAGGKHELSASDVLDGYLFFDPKMIPSSEPAILSSSALGTGTWSTGKAAPSHKKMNRTVYSDAIVFVVGGGNYVEYSNCVETVSLSSTTSRQMNVLYGTTDMVTAENFLEQLSKVGNI